MIKVLSAPDENYDFRQLFIIQEVFIAVLSFYTLKTDNYHKKNTVSFQIILS